MKTILGQVASFARSGKKIEMLSVDDIRSAEGNEVRTYSELVYKLAQLAFENPELVLLMRGQARDYREHGKTTLFPTMFRMPASGSDFYVRDLHGRYEQVRRRENQLFNVLRDTPFWDRVGRNELARWAILQHYEVCPSPLLDVTHSALVALTLMGCLPAKNPSKSIKQAALMHFIRASKCGLTSLSNQGRCMTSPKSSHNGRSWRQSAERRTWRIAPRFGLR